MLTQNQKIANALREAADWLDAHPELPSLYCSNLGVFSTYGRDIRRDLVLTAKAMGHAEKQYTGDYLCLKKDFGGVADISYVAQREQVCERVVTGKRVVPPEPEKIIPARPEREEEIVEWRCKPLMDAAQLSTGPESLPEPIPEPVALPEEVLDEIPF